MAFVFKPEEQLFTSGSFDNADQQTIYDVVDEYIKEDGSYQVRKFFSAHPEISFCKYIVSLIDKFNDEKDSLKKDAYGNVKTVSLKAWLNKNDVANCVDSSWHHGDIYNLLSEHYTKLNIQYLKSDDVEKSIKKLYSAACSGFKRHEHKWAIDNDPVEKSKRELAKLINKYQAIDGIGVMEKVPEGSMEIYIDSCGVRRFMDSNQINELLKFYYHIDDVVKFKSAGFMKTFNVNPEEEVVS